MLSTDGEPCRNYSPFNLASLFPSPLIPLALLSCHVYTYSETLHIVPLPFFHPFFLFFFFLAYIFETQHASVVCTVLINFRVLARDLTKNVDPMADFYLFRAVFSIHISDREVTSLDFSYFFFFFQIAVSIVSNSTRCSNITIRFIFYEFLFRVLILGNLIFNDAL